MLKPWLFIRHLSSSPSRLAATPHCCTVTPSRSLQNGITIKPSIKSPLAYAPSRSKPGTARVQSGPICFAREYQTAFNHKGWTSQVGAEPGIDPSVTDLKSARTRLHPDEKSEIRVVDYSDAEILQYEVDAPDLASWLDSHAKPEWAACRWIHVDGLHWDVVRRLGEHKGLHPLALEDVMDTSRLTKVDWYDNHCFLELPLQKLVESGHWQGVKEEPPIDPAVRTTSEGKEETAGDRRRARHARLKWRPLGHGDFSVSVEQVSAFLTADNTVITIFEQSGHDVFTPVWTRLNSPQTMLRQSNDPSMLLHAVIDTIVDLSLPIGKAVSNAFDELEHEVLSAPRLEQSKQLYVLRSGLTHFMENTIAIGGLVKTLCDHRPTSTATEHPHRTDRGRPGLGPELRDHRPTTVTVSPTTQIYLQDVQDHITTLSTSTRESIRSAENLTSLIFNTIAASQNESVRQLTLVSSFFLPLTFLTGYFGMNFDPMPVVNEHSDAFFWVIATPAMVGTLTLLMVKGNWISRFRARRAARRRAREKQRR